MLSVLPKLKYGKNQEQNGYMVINEKHEKTIECSEMGCTLKFDVCDIL